MRWILNRVYAAIYGGAYGFKYRRVTKGMGCLYSGQRAFSFALNSPHSEFRRQLRYQLTKAVGYRV